MEKQELLEGTNTFALRILTLVDHLPNQLVRSGSAVGANYRAICRSRAACRSRSRAEFAAKLGAVAEEADDRCTGLNWLATGGYLPRRSCKTSSTKRTSSPPFSPPAVELQ